MARDRILHVLKTKGPQRAAQLAKRLKITPSAVRQQLDLLRAEDLVAFDEPPSGVGRPARVWKLAARAEAAFPDSHGELAVGLIEAMRRAFGDAGLQTLVAQRTEAQVADYLQRLDGLPLARRVAGLARIRADEGYLAAWSRKGQGFELVENHCPICAAAGICQGLCAGELELFRRVLGPGVEVERTEHLLDGARRCVYRITRTRSGGRASP